MLGLVDATKRPLSIPARFIPYLEKYRLYELFQELAKQLLIEKPEDHIYFIQQHLRQAARNLYLPKIIFIAPPDFDRMGLAKEMEQEFQIRLITLRDIRHFAKNCEAQLSPENIASNAKDLLDVKPPREFGWIFADLPRTKEEAKAFQRIGIIPTHVFNIRLSDESSYNEVASFGPSICSSKLANEGIGNSCECLYSNVRDVQRVYADSLIDIEVGIRSLSDLAKDCVLLTNVRKHSGAPSVFRICLIGSRGAGCHTLAKYISQRFRLVHVDFDYILDQVRLQETDLGKMIRLFEHRWGHKPNSETRIKIVERYVLSPECLEKGWVLTGYPMSLEDFKLLDRIATPPNKVFFVRVDINTCRKRILSRKYNVLTASEHDISSSDPIEQGIDCKLERHPKDANSVVDSDIREYQQHIEDMLSYAGQTAFVVDGNKGEKKVREKVESCLMRPAVYAKPRLHKLPTVKKAMDIEIEPDEDAVDFW